MDAILLAKLLRLASPTLPVGAYSYSQGLEWAVESRQVTDETSARQWIASLMAGGIARFELPTLARFYQLWRDDDIAAEYLASRETAELRAESIQMGGALVNVLQSDGEHDAITLEPLESLAVHTFPNSFAFAAARWGLPLEDVLTTYVWSWLENQVTAAMKLVPLGQRAGQRMLAHLTPLCSQATRIAVGLPREDWSNFAPLLAIASSKHESQYSRLFRS